MSYKTIQNQIKEISLDSDLQETHNVLMDNYNSLLSASYSVEEARDLVLGENDALDSGEVEEETQLWLDIRDIQNQMVLELSTETDEKKG